MSRSTNESWAFWRDLPTQAGYAPPTEAARLGLQTRAGWRCPCGAGVAPHVPVCPACAPAPVAPAPGSDP